MTVFHPHVIPDHWSNHNPDNPNLPNDEDRISLWIRNLKACGATPFIKIVSADTLGMPAQIGSMPADSVFIIRDYLTSTNWGHRGIRDANSAIEMAKVHAQRAQSISELVKQQFGYRNLLFEGLNEPEVWGNEPPGLVACYEAERLKWLHSFGLNGVVLNTSVGWPDNKGAGTAPDWEPFTATLQAMKDGDYLGLHEYFWFGGPIEKHNDKGGWLWEMGRFIQCPWDVPILITECGIDDLVANGDKHLGWQNLPLNTMDNKAWQYVQWLRWYESNFDRRIKGACIFTWDIGNKEWETFDIRNDVFWSQFLPYIQDMSIKPSTAEPIGIPVVTPPVEIWGNTVMNQWHGLCETVGASQKIDPKILGTIIWIESNGIPTLRGSYKPEGVIGDWPYGEVGLGQIIPRGNPGFDERPTVSELLDPATNILWIANVYNWCKKFFPGDIRKILMSYNAGEGTVLLNPNMTDTSQNYIAKFTSAWKILWPSVALPFLENIEVQLDINSIRWNAEESVREIEATLETLNQARKRLIDLVIAPSYKVK
jgi:hypothetical protein